MAQLDKLYKTLVVGGALLAGACASDRDTRKAEATPTKEPAPVSAPAPAEPAAPDQDCAAICSAETDDNKACPDPNNDGAMNCCWLMVPERHPCCPSHGGRT